MNICVFGAASDKIDEIYIEKVEELGKTLAKRGHSLVFGAGATGLMGAAARGFAAENGKIYGVIPHFFKERGIEIIYTDCTELIYTETMRERKAKMEELADAFVIVPGGIGTFEEFFEILTLKQLGRHNKPIVIYDIEGFYGDIVKSLESAMDKDFIPETCTSLYKITSNPDEVLKYAETKPKQNYSVKELKN